MSKTATEARLIKALGLELEELALLERFNLGSAPAPDMNLLAAVDLEWSVTFADYDGAADTAMRRAVGQMIAANAREVVANAVAVQRGIVEAKRQELADFQSGRDVMRNGTAGDYTPPAAPPPPPAQDEADIDF